MCAQKTRSVIDVGTNSIKLLVGLVEGELVTPLVEKSNQTRLGKGFYTDHLLRQDAIDATAEAVAAFAETARTYSPESIRVIATSAARDAINKEELLNAIHAASGLQVEIISGAQEAAWAYCGATLGAKYDNSAVLVMDIGGGSTELNLGYGRKNRFSRSFPLGTVRILDLCPVSDPPAPEESDVCQSKIHSFVEENIRPVIQQELDQMRAEKLVFVATGGTATILGRVHLGLASYDRDKMEGAEITLATVEELNRRFWSMSVAERREVPGMPGKRADVILGGTAIMVAVMQALKLHKFIVSTRGLRFAALLDEACAPLNTLAD